ncbi:FabA-like protein [Mesocricetibacter intestinalis]|uniref:FabA-like protein n=1 Tax=Mesocricetibacter intestinalis TaxID=1521930 RepID=A0A4V3D9S0_9PAST|nr:hypothetical protein [Mesocricetibacter intestinalis]TDQ57681.1 FabA-like protein [Mesocricetibacter intestinalis]
MKISITSSHLPGEDKSPRLSDLRQRLVSHPWLQDAYIGLHPSRQEPLAWVALNKPGIAALRDKGRSHVVDELCRFVAEAYAHAPLLHLWRFSQALPADKQEPSFDQAFQQICLQPAEGPVWFNRRQTPDSLQLSGEVPPDLVYFEGHFNEFPLVPGVVELQWVFEQSALLIGKSPQAARVDNLKFQKFLRPYDNIELILQWEKAKGRIVFRLQSEQGICASGVIILND